MKSSSAYRPVRIWLILNLLLIVVMVAVGGITRLTGSGLSMVEWKPIMGTLPPMNEADWQDAFSKYQQFPQYRLINEGMDLAGFKQIFFWEYLHRVLGRLIGLVYAFPFFWFLFTGRVRGGLAAWLGGGLLLGGLQGLMGWYMVKSGLVDVPSVSHFRLAAHFTLALVVFSYLLWILLSLVGFQSHQDEHRTQPPTTFRTLLGLFAILLVLQLVYGAFVAGIKAGYFANTFPKMMGHWIPPALGTMEPGWINPFQNPIAIQFIHRCVGWALTFLAAGLWLAGWRKPWSPTLTLALHGLLLLTVVQFLLGVTTLLLKVHVVAAVLHQVTACLVLGMTVFLLYHVFGRPNRGQRGET